MLARKRRLTLPSSPLSSLLRALLWLVEVALVPATVYLGFLTAAAWLASKRTPSGPGQPRHRFLIVVPAHDEEVLLPQLLASIARLDYPRSLYTVHVVADNCHDRTAAVAHQGGAVAHQRFDAGHASKGYALRWLLERLWAANIPHDAVLILDADSVVSPNLLRVADARLARGERVIQIYYAARNPGRAWNVGLRYAALAAVHYLRPLGKTFLGGSAGLKGNGMVFAAEVLKQHPWPVSLTEDVEYHLTLLLAGQKVTFAPEATVWAEMPDTLAGAHSQNARWERGRIEMVRHYVPSLLRAAYERRSFALLDAAVEQLVPPLSILVGANVLGALAATFLDLLAVRSPGRLQTRARGFPIQLVAAVGSLTGLMVYVLSALSLARAPGSAYRALLFAPLFVVWKVWLYAQVLLGRDQQGWIRTRRNADPKESALVLPRLAAPDRLISLESR